MRKNKTKKFLFFLTLLIIAAGLWYFRDNLIKQKIILLPKNETANKTYSSSKYGFSFSYPENLEIVVSADEILLGKRGANNFEPKVIVEVLKSSSEIEIQSFEEFVLDASREACSIETESIIQTCTRIDDVVRIAPFKSEPGVAGQVFYLKGEEKDKKTGKTQSMRRGPFYTFNTSLNTPNQMSFILIGNPFEKSPDEADSPLIKSVANSLVILSIQ